MKGKRIRFEDVPTDNDLYTEALLYEAEDFLDANPQLYTDDEYRCGDSGSHPDFDVIQLKIRAREINRNLRLRASRIVRKGEGGTDYLLRITRCLEKLELIFIEDYHGKTHETTPEVVFSGDVEGAEMIDGVRISTVTAVKSLLERRNFSGDWGEPTTLSHLLHFGFEVEEGRFPDLENGTDLPWDFDYSFDQLIDWLEKWQMPGEKEQQHGWLDKVSGPGNAANKALNKQVKGDFWRWYQLTYFTRREYRKRVGKALNSAVLISEIYAGDIRRRREPTFHVEGAEFRFDDFMGSEVGKIALPWAEGISRKIVAMIQHPEHFGRNLMERAASEARRPGFTLDIQ